MCIDVLLLERYEVQNYFWGKGSAKVALEVFNATPAAPQTLAPDRVKPF